MSFTIALNIFTLRKDTTKQHYNNIRLNVLDNASLAIYRATLGGHWLVMGLKTDSSHVNTWLSKMEATIDNIVFLTTIGNLVVNQLMEREVVATLTTNVASAVEPKSITVMAKNMR
jgi:hypothetical protein